MEKHDTRAQYAAPDLKLVGGAKDVVLGSFGVGNDMSSEVLAFASEFGADPSDSIA